MNCQEFEELSGAYALGALNDGERAVADEHLAQCPRCTRLLQELQSVVDLLPLAAPEVEPSPELKERLLSRIQADMPHPVVSQRYARPVQQARRQHVRRPSWGMQLLATAAVLMLVLLGGMAVWNISLQQQVGRLSNKLAPPVIYALQGTAPAAKVSGEVLYFEQQHTAVLVLHGLPAVRGAQVYQAWLIQGKQPRSIGLLTVQNDVATLNFQSDIRGFDAAAVSLEPGPQASKDAPKGPIVALGALK